MVKTRRASDQEKSEAPASVTFFSGEEIICPICREHFKREELKSGRGRLIAGDLTDELRRLYQPSVKYGEIFPLSYPVTVCPQCYYATFPQDFAVLDKDALNLIREKGHQRYKSVEDLCGKLDFTKNRRIQEGAASHYLALLCYEDVPLNFSPTIKRGLCSLRAAWVFSDMDKKFPSENYAYVSSLFYHKALFFYRRAVELESTGKEMIAGLKSFGPDLDKNYGFDGVIYLAALLEYKYGSKTDPERRKEVLASQKRSLGRMFGLGKSSKDKPGPLLEHARNLYDMIATELGNESY